MAPLSADGGGGGTSRDGMSGGGTSGGGMSGGSIHVDPVLTQGKPNVVSRGHTAFFCFYLW